VAVTLVERIDERARVEALCRGVWLVGAGKDGQLSLVDAGDAEPSSTSVRLLMHRLLDELVWEELLARPSQGTSQAPAS
jgi:hypothetical protein